MQLYRRAGADQKHISFDALHEIDSGGSGFAEGRIFSFYEGEGTRA